MSAYGFDKMPARRNGPLMPLRNSLLEASRSQVEQMARDEMRNARLNKNNGFTQASTENRSAAHFYHYLSFYKAL